MWLIVIGPQFPSCFALSSKQIRPGLLPLATQTIRPPNDRRHCTQPMPPFCLQRLRSAIESCTVQRSKLPMERCKFHKSHITVNRPGEICEGARLLLPHRHHLCTDGGAKEMYLARSARSACSCSAAVVAALMASDATAARFAPAAALTATASADVRARAACKQWNLPPFW